MADDGQVLSYVIKTDKGCITTRNKCFHRLLLQAIVSKIQQTSLETNLPPSDSKMGPTTHSAHLRRSRRALVTTQSEECQNKGIFNDSPVFYDTTRIATRKTPLWWSLDSLDGEIILPNPADQTESTSDGIRRSSRLSKLPVPSKQSKPRHTIKQDPG